jgi:regulator of protease activity HflC (stomatin/prohibitin superfamily)
MDFFGGLTAFIFVSFVAGWNSIKVVSQGEEALVETLGKYSRKLSPGLNFITPVMDRVAYRNTVKEQVLDIPPQQCITRDNVSITADAVVYWRIVDMEKAWYRVENLRQAMTNIVLTQIRAELGNLELDQTFTARSQINEILLRDLDEATDPWGVKVTRVELRDILPAKAVQESMELQMTAERKKRSAILTSEGERESAINKARGQADAQILTAEAAQKAAILEAEGVKQARILKAEAERQEKILRSQGTAQALQVLLQASKDNPQAKAILQFLLAQNYIDMGTVVGSSGSSKVLFMDPRAIASTLEGIKSVVGDVNTLASLDTATSGSDLSNWSK